MVSQRTAELSENVILDVLRTNALIRNDTTIYRAREHLEQIDQKRYLPLILSGEHR